MRILITGANGLLGQHLVTYYLSKPNVEVHAIARGPQRYSVSASLSRFQYHSLDLQAGLAVVDLVELLRPEIIIHAAAMTQIDQAELDPIGCWGANVTATRFLLLAAAQVGAKFLFVSTDFVFDGLAGPYSETDQPAPVNYYGASKWAAEKAVADYSGWWAIVRTVLVYGTVSDGSRSHFITWVKRELEANRSIRVVQDQWRTPTYVNDLVSGIALVLEANKSGLWHISGTDTLTPYEMALATANLLNLPAELIQPVTTDTFTQPGKRPPRTGFIINKAKGELGYQPHSFEAGLKLMLTN